MFPLWFIINLIIKQTKTNFKKITTSKNIDNKTTKNSTTQTKKPSQINNTTECNKESFIE